MPIYNTIYIKIIDFNKKIRNVNSKFYKILQDQINRFVPLDNIFLKKFSSFFILNLLILFTILNYSFNLIISEKNESQINDSLYGI